MGNATWKPLEGQVIGNEYCLKALAGIDEEGAAFRAERLGAGRRPAMVRLMAAGAGGQEARILELAAAGTRHPHLVECFGAGLWEPPGQRLFFLATEASGTQFSSVIQHWPASVQQVREMVRGVASALCYLHGGEVPAAHGGVHPANVMLIDGQWKLSELGAAPAGGPLAAGDLQDAPAYTPPEGITGPASDIWSLGVMIVRALTGALPFRSGQARPVRAPLPPPFGVIAAGCLQEDPGSRWTAGQVLEAVGGPPGSPGVDPSIQNRRWRVWAAVALAGLAAMAIGVFLILRSSGEEPLAVKEPPSERARFLDPPAGETSPLGATSEYSPQLKLIRRVEPEYPLAAREARISGTVRLRIVVNPDGTVRDVSVVSGPALLAASAVRAVRQWRFQPVLANGQPAAFATHVDLHFPLR